jgi:hypothetical protein
MQTRRYPRTLQEAFGPYTSGQIEPMRSTHDTHPADKFIYGIGVLVAIGLVLHWMGVL